MFSEWQETLFPTSISESNQALEVQLSPEHKERFFLVCICSLAEGWGMQLQAFYASLVFLLEEVIWDLASAISESPHALPFLAMCHQHGCKSHSS